MNKTAINARIKARHLNLSSWCKAKNISYPMAYNMLSSKTRRIQETRKQLAAIDALIADGLYVPDVDEGVLVCEVNHEPLAS